MPEPLVKITGLKKHFPISRGLGGHRLLVRAVDGIDLDINPGETVGLVGESGCGKTTVGRLILKLIEPSAGAILFDGNDLAKCTQKQMHPLRKTMQIIFQDPFASLNPRMTISETIGRPMEIHGRVPRSQRNEMVSQLLESVGLKKDHLSRFPHEFSGGQRQRIGIARALATHPKLIVADEPTSALDVSVQAQILNLLKNLQRELGLTYLFISHNIGVIRHVSDRIAVMYLGKVVEMANKKAVFQAPLHPYTKALLASVPSLDPRHKRDDVILEGDVPSPINPPEGCRFHTRCSSAMAKCRTEEPFCQQLEEARWVACHLYS